MTWQPWIPFPMVWLDWFCSMAINGGRVQRILGKTCPSRVLSFFCFCAQGTFMPTDQWITTLEGTNKKHLCCPVISLPGQACPVPCQMPWLPSHSAEASRDSGRLFLNFSILCIFPLSLPIVVSNSFHG